VTHDRIIANIPKLGKHISTTHLIEKYKIVGSVARALLKKAVENGSIRSVEQHSRQALYTPTQEALEKIQVAATATAAQEGAAKKGKKK
jgi:ribosomal protein S25